MDDRNCKVIIQLFSCIYKCIYIVLRISLFVFLTNFSMIRLVFRYFFMNLLFSYLIFKNRKLVTLMLFYSNMMLYFLPKGVNTLSFGMSIHKYNPPLPTIFSIRVQFRFKGVG